jgi:predicted P-loop ATPase
MNNPIPPNEQNIKSRNIEVSYYESLTDKINSNITLKEILDLIKAGNGCKETILKLRQEPNKTKQQELKKTLPAVTISGLFKQNRKIESLLKHSGFICLDFDNISNIESVKILLEKDEYTYALFISPSGTGLKMIVRIPNNPAYHKIYFNELKTYYSDKYKLKVDIQCNDISRLMFLSWDVNLFTNENSSTWQIKSNNENYSFKSVLHIIEQKAVFKKGERNNFIYKLACECNKAGIDINLAITEIINRFRQEDFPVAEIKATIKSAYAGKSNNDTKVKISKRNEYSLLARTENYLQAKYDIRFNKVSTKVEYKIKGASGPFKEINENSFYRDLVHNDLPLSLNKLSSLLLSDFVPTYDPFVEYFYNLELWNTKTDFDYIEKLASFIPVKDPERFAKQLRKMFVRCIACALDDKFFNKQVFVLVGETQNTGKSTFCRWLCPNSISDYITENINTDKDSLISLATNFLINMDELATLSRSEINSLKSLISKDKINVRLPFGKKAITMPRRASFIGSTNKDEFLTDETGSVRWLCFVVTGMINFNYMAEIDINDVWRQAFALYKSGFEYQLTPKEIEENEIANSSFNVTSIEMELIPKFYMPSTKENNGIFLNATDILIKLTALYPGTRINIHAIGRALKMLGFKKESQYSDERKYSQKGYFMKSIEV